jgi:hypothetical protein
MDLRRDLSIRSSRLPIIMDAAERQFGITIELEDFINVRTVKDIAQRISKVIARQGGTSLQPATKADDPGPVRDEILKSSEDEVSLKRLVFNHATVELAASIPMDLSPGESVLLLSPDRDDGIARSAGDILRLDYGVDTFPMLFSKEFISKAPSPSPSPSRGEGCNISPPLRGGDYNISPPLRGGDYNISPPLRGGDYNISPPLRG